MNLNKEVLDDLWSGEKSICFFVSGAKCYWVLDYKYNFPLDAEKDYRAYLDKGHITQAQYEEACRVFRGGILKLTADNFSQYLNSVSEGVLTGEDLSKIFELDDDCSLPRLLKEVEGYFLSGASLSADIFGLVGRVASRLPVFYINFDRKIYMHMDQDRFHEELSYSDWTSKCSDFSFLIPDAERYWMKSGDLWKFRYV